MEGRQKWAISRVIWPFLANFWLILAIFGHFCAISGQNRPFLAFWRYDGEFCCFFAKARGAGPDLLSLGPLAGHRRAHGLWRPYDRNFGASAKMTAGGRSRAPFLAKSAG